MPKMSCTKDGKSGKKYGESGACYTGADKDAKVEAQRRAIKASQHNAVKKAKARRS